MTRSPLNQLTLNKWVLYTTGGWILGVVLLIMLSSLLELQTMVGLGMSTGVGLLQWILLRKHAGMKATWLWYMILGFFISFIVIEITSDAILHINPETYIPIATLFGALLTGWLHYRYILHKIYEDATNWILMNTLGWTAAAVITFIAFMFNSHLPRTISIPIAFILVAIGGPILALISGPTILSILSRTKMTGINTGEPAGMYRIIQKEGDSPTGVKNHGSDSIG